MEGKDDVKAVGEEDVSGGGAAASSAGASPGDNGVHGHGHDGYHDDNGGGHHDNGNTAEHGGGLTVLIPPVGSGAVVGHLRSPSEIMLDDIAESLADTTRKPSFARMQSVQVNGKGLRVLKNPAVLTLGSRASV